MIAITKLSGSAAYDLIYPQCLAMLSEINQETMQRSMMNSSQVQVYREGDNVLCFWGLIPPSLLSDRAYLWLYTTEYLKGHTFALIRHSQRAVEEMTRDFPLLVGHCAASATQSIRWLRWLRAEFGSPCGKLIPFQIRAESWLEQ